MLENVKCKHSFAVKYILNEWDISRYFIYKFDTHHFEQNECEQIQTNLDRCIDSWEGRQKERETEWGKDGLMIGRIDWFTF